VPAGRSGVTGGVFIILLLAAAFLAYRAIEGAPAWFGGILAAIQVSVIVWLSTRGWSPRSRASVLGGTLAGGVVMAALLPVRDVSLMVGGGCHAIAYASLLLWFSRSLRAGQEPVVTAFARRIRRTMPDKVVRYTRQVTVAWCVFFAAQLAVSAGLLALAPPEVWVAFVTLLNLPLLAAMMLGEFATRMILFRHEPHTGLIDTIAALRQARFTQ
jgi:uncharacterized membrane protein